MTTWVSLLVHQDRHVLGALADGLANLVRSLGHLGAGDRVAVGVPGDRRVELLDALVVAGNAVVAGVPGGPGLAGMIAIGTAES